MKKLPAIVKNSSKLWQIPPLKATDHKYTRGHVLVFGGDHMTGAARLVALAAQRAGAGLVTLAAPPKAWPIYAASLVSVIARPCNAVQWTAIAADKRVNPVVIGPGAGVGARTGRAIAAAAKAGKTLILDADALTLLASDKALRKKLMGVSMILTPHEGEYVRLAKVLALPLKADKRARAFALAKAFGAVVVLKGTRTMVVDSNGRAVVTHPPAWLATGGTGDVLAGIIAALVGQGMALFEAACVGVWLHAEAARGFGPGMVAEDVIEALPSVLRSS